MMLVRRFNFDKAKIGVAFEINFGEQGDRTVIVRINEEATF